MFQIIIDAFVLSRFDNLKSIVVFAKLSQFLKRIVARMIVATNDDEIFECLRFERRYIALDIGADIVCRCNNSNLSHVDISQLFNRPPCKAFARQIRRRYIRSFSSNFASGLDGCDKRHGLIAVIVDDALHHPFARE